MGRGCLCFFFFFFENFGCISVATLECVLHYTKHFYVTADKRDDLSCAGVSILFYTQNKA